MTAMESELNIFLASWKHSRLAVSKYENFISVHTQQYVSDLKLAKLE